ESAPAPASPPAPVSAVSTASACSASAPGDVASAPGDVASSAGVASAPGFPVASGLDETASGLDETASGLDERASSPEPPSVPPSLELQDAAARAKRSARRLARSVDITIVLHRVERACHGEQARHLLQRDEHRENYADFLTSPTSRRIGTRGPGAPARG